MELIAMGIRWSRLGFPMCLFNRHSPVREGAHWDGKTYHGTCRHCGEAIVRKSRGLWKKKCADRAPA